MKYLKQFGIILVVTFIGELIHMIIPLPIPGSIYGLVLMFILLCTHALKLEAVKETAQFLIDSWSDLRPILLQTVVILVVSTIIVMIVTGKIAQFIIDQSKGAAK
jgi:holin-like protein